MDEICKLIKRLEKEHNYEEALRHMEIAFEEQSCSFDIRKDIGRVYNKLRQFEKATKNFDIVLGMDDSNPEYLFGKGISLIGLNKFDEASEFFEKLINVNKQDANAWYYMGLLAKSLGNSKAQKYFNEFLKLDNDDFKNIRQYYKFGIELNEYEQELRGLNKLNVLSDLKDEINSLNLSPIQYNELVRLVPLEDLFDKILEFKGSKFGTDTEDIIRKEFKKQGLFDSDIDNLFKIETIQNLKSEVIEMAGENPFPESNNYSSFTPLKLASKYNVKPHWVKKNPDLLLYNKGNIYFDGNEIETAIEIYDEALKINPDNFLLKFVKFCANYKLNGDNDV